MTTSAAHRGPTTIVDTPDEASVRVPYRPGPLGTTVSEAIRRVSSGASRQDRRKTVSSLSSKYEFLSSCAFRARHEDGESGAAVRAGVGGTPGQVGREGERPGRDDGVAVFDERARAAGDV